MRQWQFIVSLVVLLLAVGGATATTVLYIGGLELRLTERTRNLELAVLYLSQQTLHKEKEQQYIRGILQQKSAAAWPATAVALHVAPPAFPNDFKEERPSPQLVDSVMSALRAGVKEAGRVVERFEQYPETPESTVKTCS